MLWIDVDGWAGRVTVQAFWRSMCGVRQVLAVATRNRPCTLQYLKKPGVHWFRRGL